MTAKSIDDNQKCLEITMIPSGSLNFRTGFPSPKSGVSRKNVGTKGASCLLIFLRLSAIEHFP
jgi:hypothetical protein